MKAKQIGMMLVVAHAVAGPGAAAAQSVGIKLGMSSSNVHVSPKDEAPQSRVGSFEGGAFVKFSLAGVGLQADVLTMNKGTKTKDPSGSGDFVQLKLRYIEVPLTATQRLPFPIGYGDGARPMYVFGGPSFALRVGCRIEARFEDQSSSAGCDDGDSESSLRKLDVGAVAGLGLNLPMYWGIVFVEARHTWGLSRIARESGGNPAVRNRSIGIMAGIEIPLHPFADFRP